MNRRKIILALGFSFVFLLIIFLANYSLLTIKGVGTDNKTVYINDDKGKLVKQLLVGDSTKTSVVKRGTYSINVVSEEKQSIYEKRVDFLSSNNLSVETKDQKQSLYLGRSNLACGKNNENKPVFYSCKPSALGLVNSEESSESALLTESLEDTTFSQSLKPYGTEFIKASASKSSSSIQKTSNAGTAIGSSVSLSDFKGFISDASFSVSSEGESFGLFDKSKNQILRFNDLSDKSPVKLDIPADTIDTEHFETKIVVGKNYTYLLSYNTELHKHEEDKVDIPSTQKVLVYNLEGKLVNTYEISSEWFIRGVAESPNDKILFFVSEEGEERAYLFSDEKSIQKLNLGVASIGQACWQDSNTIYYTGNSSSNIFKYSLNEKASYLEYGGLVEGSIIGSINCVKGGMTFTVESDKDGEDNYAHYTLGSKNYSGVRKESVLPLYIDFEDSVLKASMDKSGIKTSVVYGDPAYLASKKESVSSILVERLKSNGVNIDKSEIVFGY